MEYNSGSTYGYDMISPRIDPTALFSTKILNNGSTFMASENEYPKMKNYNSPWKKEDLITPQQNGPQKLVAPPGIIEGYSPPYDFISISRDTFMFILLVLFVFMIIMQVRLFMKIDALYSSDIIKKTKD